LGKEQFGELGIIQSTIAMFTVFASFGVGMTATKYVAEFRRTNPQRAGSIVFSSTVIALASAALMATLLLIFAPWLARNALAAPHLTPLLRISAASLFFGAFQGAQTGALAGFEAFRTIAYLSLMNGVSSFLFLIAGVTWGGIKGAVISSVASLALACFVTHVALTAEARKLGIRIRSAQFTSEWRALLHFSFPALLSTIMVSPINWVCRAMVVNNFHGGYAQMGVYNAANQWQASILFLPSCLSAITLPVLSNLYAERRLMAYRQTLIYSLILNGGSSLAIASLVSLVSGHIMAGYGATFVEGRSVLIVLAFSAVPFAAGSVVGSAIISSGQIWYGFLFNMLWACSILGFSFLLIPKYGAMGLAAATLLSYSVHFLWQTAYFIRFLRFPPRQA
jgi:O-antigen/teichoic acid export membrane protein